MRRMILTSLALIPMVAHAAASTSTEPKPSTSSAMAAEQPKPAASFAALTTSNHAAIREFVQTQMVDNFVEAALHQGGSLEYAMMGSVPTHSSAPQVTQAVELDLSAQDMAEQPTVSKVVLRAIVDENGIPRNVQVAQSAGPVVDRKAIAAVNQYRFKPATLDNKPTWASVTIAIKIQKQ
jgi:TonB family protein